MYSRILLAYDATEHGKHALAAAIDLASRCQAHLVIVTIIEDLPRYAQGTIDSVDEYVEGARRFLEEAHQAAQKEAGHAKVSTSSIIEPGHVVETIVHLAKKEKADVIVLGGIGRSRMLHSRTGVQIYLSTPCPLLIVH